MSSLAQTSSATIASSKRNRFVGWSAIASGLALIIVGQKPYFPSSLSLVLLVATLALYLGMVPVARWIASGLVARDSGERARIIRAVEIACVAGAVIAATTAILALPHWLPAVPAQILNTTALGVIGLWLAVSNVLAFRARLYNRVLAIIGVVAGSDPGSWSPSSCGPNSLRASAEAPSPRWRHSARWGSYIAGMFNLIWALGWASGF